MAEYQNIFTRVQVRGPGHTGVPLPRGSWKPAGKPLHSSFMALLGDAQIGPISLGFRGFASLICGFTAIEIIALILGASVNWSPIRFVRQLFWLALEPPPPA